MITYLGHNYSLTDCEIVLLNGKEYITSFDENNFFKFSIALIRKYLRNGGI